jgi:hypothetical protein
MGKPGAAAGPAAAPGKFTMAEPPGKRQTLRFEKGPKEEQNKERGTKVKQTKDAPLRIGRLDPVAMGGSVISCRPVFMFMDNH